MPVDRSNLGNSALSTEPVMEQWFVTRSNKMTIEDTESQARPRPAPAQPGQLHAMPCGLADAPV